MAGQGLFACCWRLGANKGSLDNEGRSALHHAAIHGKREAVCLLLESGASKDVLDKFGVSALHLAAKLLQQRYRSLASGGRGEPRRA